MPQAKIGVIGGNALKTYDVKEREYENQCSLLR